VLIKEKKGFQIIFWLSLIIKLKIELISFIEILSKNPVEPEKTDNKEISNE